MSQYTPGVLRGYRFRLYPTRAQEAALEHALDLLRGVYNAALEERREAFRKQGVAVTKAMQEKSLTEIKHDCPAFADVHTHLLQDVITRVDRAFHAFFRRCARGERPGYPRFKGRDRYHTFTFKDAGKGNGAAFVAGGKRLRLSGVGHVKVKVHRAMEGALKTIGVTLDGDGHWYALITREVAPKPLLATGLEVGVDVALSTFAATSDGELLANPRPLESARLGVERAQRTVSRRPRGSKRRRKARALLARAHARVRNTRKDFHHKTARALVRRYDRIAVEDLNFKGLARGMLARPVHDAAWSQVITFLRAKAEEAGRVVVAVDPRGTSQQCSACGGDAPKSRSERQHRCPHCGLVEDRDTNAAKNILARAVAAAWGSDQGPGHGLRGAAPTRRRGRPRRMPDSDDPRSPLLAR